MKRVLFTTIIALCFISTAKPEDEFFTRPIVVSTPNPGEFKTHKNLVYLDTAEGRTLADIFLPTGSDKKQAAVIFVHGGPIPKNLPAAKDWQFFQSYGYLVASAGLAGVVFNHRFNSLNDLQTANGDIRAAVEFVRANSEKYSIDKDRICLWFFSGAGSFVAPFLSERPKWLKCMAIYYAILGPEVWENTGEKVPDAQRVGLDPFPLLESKSDWDPAFFIAEAGKDNAALNAGLQQFAQTALINGWKLEYWNHPTGPHGFDLEKDDQRSREIILRTINFLQVQLDPNGENE